jgi:hypothetical protein
VGYLLITEENFHEQIGDGRSVFFAGHERMLTAQPKRWTAGAPDAPPQVTIDRLVPRDQWPDLIAKKDEEKSWLEDICRAASLKVKDQNGRSLCHGYAVAHVMEVQRLVQAHPYVELSAESITGQMNGFRDAGGMPDDDMAVAVEYGACPASMMDKPWSLSPNRWNPNWKTERLNYRVSEWIDLELGGSKTFDAQCTAAFLGIPFAMGVAWWSHAFASGFRVVLLGKNRYALRCRNNWGADYGDDGYMDLEEGRGTANLDCIAPVQMTAFDRSAS